MHEFGRNLHADPDQELATQVEEWARVMGEGFGTPSGAETCVDGRVQEALDAVEQKPEQSE